jgi:hypothetical protein
MSMTDPANTQGTDTKPQPMKAVSTKTGDASGTAAGIARVRRFGIDPNKIGEVERDKLQSVGINPDTFERGAVTWDGLIEEFGRPVGPQLYNAIATVGWRGVPANRGDLSIETLKDRWLMPRQRKESEEDFNKRMEKHRATRARVDQLIAEAEGGAK